ADAFEQQYTDVLLRERGLLHLRWRARGGTQWCQIGRVIVALQRWTRAAGTGRLLGRLSIPPAMTTDHRLQRLLDAVPDLRLLTEAADLEYYGRDWTRRWMPAPLAIALPATVDEVQAVVRWANAEGVAIVPS